LEQAEYLFQVLAKTHTRNSSKSDAEKLGYDPRTTWKVPQQITAQVMLKTV
jgi:hypothetical protein